VSPADIRANPSNGVENYRSVALPLHIAARKSMRRRAPARATAQVLGSARERDQFRAVRRSQRGEARFAEVPMYL